MNAPLLTTEIRYEPDVVLARQRARQIAALLGFDVHEQTRIATAVSEIARNVFQYAGGGTVGFALTTQTPRVFEICIRDQGPGIADLLAILEGRYKSPTGMGLGIMGARRLMDRFDIAGSGGAGTTVVMGKTMPPAAPAVTPALRVQIAVELARSAPQNPFQEMQAQNQELLQALEIVRVRQAEADRLNRELEETNRGVMALYAELDDKAEALRKASETKSRFLSNIGHEIRTPLNAILSLSRLLLDHVDGSLTEEQTKQVQFIRSSGESLSELVSDLLDLARIEAGKTVVRPRTFTVEALFGALLGMFRPLHADKGVMLVFDDTTDLPSLMTDEGKVAQILRNFISNALKFTERGVVRVSASLDSQTDLLFAVSDTGIGIAPDDLERIFEEFTQVENPMQQRVRGTGLGLPLTHKLAELLGGRTWVRSTLGAGSTFYASIPLTYMGDRAAIGGHEAQPQSEIIGGGEAELMRREAGHV